MPAGDYTSRPIAQGGVFQPRTAIEYGEAQILPQTPVPDFARYAEIELKKQLLKQEQDEKARSEAEIPAADIFHAAVPAYQKEVSTYHDWYEKESKTRRNDPAFQNEVRTKRTMLIEWGKNLKTLIGEAQYRDKQIRSKKNYEGEADWQEINSIEWWNKKIKGSDTYATTMTEAENKLGNIREKAKIIDPDIIYNKTILPQIRVSIEKNAFAVIRDGSVMTVTTEQLTKDDLMRLSASFMNRVDIQDSVQTQYDNYIKSNPEEEGVHESAIDWWMENKLSLIKNERRERLTRGAEGITETKSGWKTSNFSFSYRESAPMPEQLAKLLTRLGFEPEKTVQQIDIQKVVGVDITDIALPSPDDPSQKIEAKVTDLLNTSQGIYVKGTTKQIILTKGNITKEHEKAGWKVGDIFNAPTEYYYPLEDIADLLNAWTGTDDIMTRSENEFAKKGGKEIKPETGKPTKETKPITQKKETAKSAEKKTELRSKYGY